MPLEESLTVVSVPAAGRLPRREPPNVPRNLRPWDSRQRTLYLLQGPPAILAGFQSFFQLSRAESGLVIGLRLGQAVAVGAYYGADSGVAAACHGVVHEDYGLDAPGDLDGAARVPDT